MMLDGLFTNTSSRKDFIQNALAYYSDKSKAINIAVAFITEIETIKLFSQKDCRVRVVFRLGYPTSPKALKELLEIRNVEARFFSDRSFHPKLYIFGSSDALIGSANLTNSAILTNQEIMVHLGSEDERFTELAALFSQYWVEAKVLTMSIVDKYSRIYFDYRSLYSETLKLENEVQDKIGKVVFHNIGRDKVKESKENLYLEDYQKTYQECVGSFNVIRKVYESVGARKVPESKIPLRLEIDSFISFVREEHAVTDTWMTTSLDSGESQKQKIQELVNEWHRTSWPYFEETIVNINYPRLLNVFSSKGLIVKATDDELFDALCVVHSFHDRRRFYLGGLETLKREFIGQNDPVKIRESLVYLIFGKDDILKRMANLLFAPNYKLNLFGQSNVQELIGWCNTEELPVINGRTTKVLRYFGFDVRQL
ncbi:MAG: phospholipase D-like domain-containing protein [Desulfobaccales bacterium]